MTHGIKTWTFEFHVIPGRGVPDYEDQQLVQQTFDRNLRRLVEPEGYGFEGVFFSEHHFLNSEPRAQPPDRSPRQDDAASASA